MGWSPIILSDASLMLLLFLFSRSCITSLLTALQCCCSASNSAFTYNHISFLCWIICTDEQLDFSVLRLWCIFPLAEARVVFFLSIIAKLFLGFSVTMITREPLHLDWWKFAWTCTSTSLRTLLNFKVMGQQSRSQDQIFYFFIFLKGQKKVCLQGYS